MAGEHTLDTDTPNIPILVQHTLINILRLFWVLKVGFNDELAEIKLPMPSNVRIS